MSKLALSVVILNHRNDVRLEKCLKSVNFADEILILDDSSNVDWKKHPEVTVEKIACPIDDFGAIRNQGLKLVKHEWVLFLDSDEYLETAAQKHLETAINQKELDGFWFQRQDIFAGRKLKHGEVGQLRFLRLFRRQVTHFERTVHEFAVVAGETGNIDTKIMHEPHLSVTEFIQKIDTYAAIEAKSRPRYSRSRWLFEIICFPIAKFKLNYCLKLGFLDGWQGLVYAYCMSLHSLLVRVYIYEQQQTN